jgi:RHS repeat-associated protein
MSTSIIYVECGGGPSSPFDGPYCTDKCSCNGGGGGGAPGAGGSCGSGGDGGGFEISTTFSSGSGGTGGGSTAPAGGKAGGGGAGGTVCITGGPDIGGGPFGPVFLSSNNPVRYVNGAAILEEIDLSVPNGGLFGHRRFYNNVTPYNGPNGVNWYVNQLPVVVADGDNRAVVFEANNPAWFDYDNVNDIFEPRYSQPNLSLVRDGVTLIFTDTNNGQTEITTFRDTDEAVGGGQFLDHTDGRGVETTVTATLSNGLIQRIERQYTVSGTDYFESLLYQYSAGKIQYVVFQRKTGSGAWSSANDVKRVAYEYYGDSDANGAPDDLKKAIQQVPDGSGGWNDVAVSYYRYYTSNTSTGFPHGMKMRFGPEAWRRMLADSLNPLTASDSTIKPYADNYFEYGDLGQIKLEIAAVCDTCVGGGTTSDSFVYSTNGNAPAAEYNNWQYKTVQTLPDGATQTVYSNFAGMPMLVVYTASNTTDKWYTFYRYDENYPQLIWQAESSAINGYSESYDDLLNYNSGTGKYQYLNDSAGLIKVIDYYSSTNIGSGQVKNYVSAIKVRQGQTGSDVLVRSFTYTSQSDTDGNTIYPLATIVDYPDATNSSITITTSFAYTWHSGTTQMATRTTTLPVVSTAQNGSNSATTIVETFDIYGNLTQIVDERGITNSYSYDVVLGVMTQQVLNVSGTTGAGYNVTTDYTYDTDGRLTQVLGPSHTAELSGTATTVRTATWYVYKQATQPSSGTGDLDQTWVGQGYATGSSPSYTYTLVGPVSITRTDKNGRVVDQITSARTTGSGKLSATDTFAQTDWKSWSSTQYDDQGHTTSSRVYHLIPSSGTGSVTTNYGQTDYGYDALERQNKVMDAAGTITRTVWTAPQRVASVWVGTDDTGATDSNPAGSGAPNNMVKVSENQYDGGSAGGDGNLTQVTQYADGSDTRVTSYGYDFRNRRTSMDGEIDVYEQYTYDNLGRLTRTDRKNTTSGGNLIGRNDTKYDDRGRVYQQIAYAVDPDTGSVGNALTSNTWYDASGNVLQQVAAGDGIVFSKNAYNGAGWVTASYRGYNPSGTSYSQAGTVANDVIVEQSENTYNEAGEVISAASYQRLNDAPWTGSGSTGALTAGSDPKARVSYMAMYYDGIGRNIATANYGAISSFTRPSTTPTRSDDILVTTTSYDAAGRADSVIDPKAIETRTTFDAAGRTTNTKEAYGTGDERETQYTYTLDNQIATLVAVNATTGNQTTTYTYGTTLTESDVANNGLLRFVAYPDSSGNSDRVKYTYNRLGQQKTMEDQRGTVHTYEYDKLGRLAHDRITTVGSNTDSAVLRITRAYEVRGMLQTVTSYNNATAGSGTVLNDVKLEYNSFSQLVKEWQDHGAAVSGSSPKVEYSYADGSFSSNQIRPTSITYPDSRVIGYDYGDAPVADCSGCASSIELTVSGSGAGDFDGIVTLTQSGDSCEWDGSYATSTWPSLNVQLIADGDDYTLTITALGETDYFVVWRLSDGDYTPPCPQANSPSDWVLESNDVPNSSTPSMSLSKAGPGSLMDYLLNRIQSIKDSSTTLAKYTYLGAGTVVQIEYEEPEVKLDLWGGNSGTFDGLDRFNRIIDQRWVSYASGMTDLDRYKYGYDRNSNRQWKENDTATNLDEYYTYDNLNRLSDMKRGQLTGSPPSGISGTPAKEQAWTLDKTGNWSGFVTKTTGTTDLNQTRTSNTVNEITGITESVGTSWPDPTYDAAGNTITMPQPANLGSSYTAVYDAWNRMVSLSASSTMVAGYAYDGRGRRIVKSTYVGGTLAETRRFYYSSNWQILEEWVSGSMDVQYYWGTRYVDELICRNNTSGRMFALQDANFNVTAITDDTATAAVQERYVFYPYGQRLIYDASWSPRGSSSYDWLIGHQGLMHDAESGLIYNNNRILHPALGRFSGRSPWGYIQGRFDLYDYCKGNPVDFVEPFSAVRPLPTGPIYPRLPEGPLGPPTPEPPTPPEPDLPIPNPSSRAGGWAAAIWWFLWGPGCTSLGSSDILPPSDPPPLPYGPFGPPNPDPPDDPDDRRRKCREECNETFDMDERDCWRLRTPKAIEICVHNATVELEFCLRRCNGGWFGPTPPGRLK